MKNKKLLKGLVVSLVVVALAAVSVGIVSAHNGGWLRGSGIDEEALLAEELGITVEKLEAAREQARTRAMEQALADGLITEEQYADYQVHEALEPYLDRDALKAVALGVSVDEVDDKTTSEWLDELGIDEETYRTKLQEAHDAAIAQAVADGVITQEQADALPDYGPGMEMPGGRRGHDRGGEFGGRGMMDGDTDCLQDGSGATQDSAVQMRRGAQGNDL